MDFLRELGIEAKNSGASTGQEWSGTKNQGELEVISPIDGRNIASAGKRRPEGDGSLGRMPGKRTCAARPIP